MITWQETNYGYYFVFAGIITVHETETWVNEVKESITDGKERFSVFVDMRRSVIFPNECKQLLENIQGYCRQHGMIRSVVIVSDDVTFRQMTLIAKKTGIYNYERYINSESYDNWEEIGMDWIKDGIDPDQPIVFAGASHQASS